MQHGKDIKTKTTEKMKLAQKHIKSWITSDKDKPYKEDSTDVHPLRSICKVLGDGVGMPVFFAGVK